jgi:hypothetical protein
MPTATTYRPDAKLVHPLTKLQGLIRRFVVLDVILFVGLFLTLWFWLGMAFDYGLFKVAKADLAQQYTPIIRWVLLLLVGGLLITLVVLRVRGLMNKDMSYANLALVLEKRYPKVLGDRLITAIEMADEAKAEKEGYSVDLVRNTVNEARERIDQVNVNSVFQWGKLTKKLIGIVGVSLIGLVVAYGLHAWSSGGLQFPVASKKLADVAGIWTERNLLMFNTPWPRRAHLEIVDFDDDGHANELRVGKGAPIPPKISAKVYQWVVVDRGSYDGWRPMKMADLDTFGVGPHASLASPMPEATVDEFLKGNNDQTAALAEKLDAAAADLANTRKLRKLVVPGSLAMTYNVISTRSRVELPLNLDSNGTFSNDITGLSESIKFSIAAEDYVSQRKTITVVAPPTLIELYRDEYQPAYLHHAAPILTKEEADAIAQQNVLATSNPQFALRGLRQARPNQAISITSDRSLFSVPLGTELVIVGKADKDLKKIELKPVTPNVKPAFLSFPHNGNNASFSVTFDKDNPIRQIEKPTEFQLVMTDLDNVVSTRSIAIQCIDDAPPSVDVIVDPIIRRQGGYLLVTPQALIPFLPDSKISDDIGLNSLRFEYKKEEDEATSLVVARALSAASLNVAGTTAQMNIGLPITLATHQKMFNDTFASTIPQQDSTGNEKLPGLPFPRFTENYGGIQRKNLATIKALLGKELVVDPNATSQLYKSLKLTETKIDGFDLDAYIPTLYEKDKEKIQPRYKVELFVVAADTNVELTDKTGRILPTKTTRNLDPIRLQIVAEADLLVEIAKDEDMLRLRLEDALKKANDAQRKLISESTRMNGVSRDNANLTASDVNQIKNSQVLVTDLIQDVAKARDLLTTLRSECEKLFREMEYNRINEAAKKKYSDPEQRSVGYLDLLKQIFEKSLPAAETALNNFASPLGSTQRPSDETIIAAKSQYALFMKDLDTLYGLFGEHRGIEEQRAILKKLIEAEQLSGVSINSALELIRLAARLPNFTVPKVVQVQVGKTAKVKVAMRLNQFVGTEAYVALDIPATSEIKGPKDFVMKVGASDLDETVYEFEITGGSKPGLYNLRLLPGPFLPNVPIKPVELTVEVTK